MMRASRGIERLLRLQQPVILYSSSSSSSVVSVKSFTPFICLPSKTSPSTSSSSRQISISSNGLYRITRRYLSSTMSAVELAASLDATSQSSSSSSTVSGTAPADLPNPRETPSIYDFAYTYSTVMDPDGILRHQQANDIEHVIHEHDNEGGRIYVLVVKKMKPLPEDVQDNVTAEKACQRFTDALHKQWGLDSPEHSNSVLIFLSVEDHVWHLSPGAGVRGRLGDLARQRVKDGATVYLRRGEYGEAILQAVNDVQSKIHVSFLSLVVPGREESVSQGLAILLGALMSYVVMLMHQREVERTAHIRAAVTRGHVLERPVWKWERRRTIVEDSAQ